jgi:hypothetical protein
MIKLLGLFCVFISFIGSAVAAPDFAKAEQIRSKMRSQKLTIVLDSMELTTEQEAIFAPIYNEYNQKIMLIRDQRFVQVKKYFENYSTMDDEISDALAKALLGLTRESTDLRETYYKKMAKSLSPVLAIRFLQVENQFTTLLNNLRVRTVPLIKTPEEVAAEFGLGVSTPVNVDATSVTNDKIDEKMNERIEEERKKKGY